MGVKWPFKSPSPYVLISHESFTSVSPVVFLCSYKSLIINVLQDIVRVSFSAPDASQQCGAFLLCPAGLATSPIVQVTLVQENFGRTTIPCTSLAELADHRPNSGRLEQENPRRSAFRCTSETCTSLCARSCRVPSFVDSRSLSGMKSLNRRSGQGILARSRCSIGAPPQPAPVGSVHIITAPVTASQECQ